MKSILFELIWFLDTADNMCMKQNPAGLSRGLTVPVTKPKQFPFPQGHYFFQKTTNSLLFPGVSPGVWKPMINAGKKGWNLSIWSQHIMAIGFLFHNCIAANQTWRMKT
jgi:hypothetical protein